MRTPKVLYPDERIIYKPELSACPHCGESLVMCDYLAWDKTVQTLEAVLSIASRPACCADARCAGHDMRLVSAEGQQIAPRGFTYGYDVLARIGWLRQERRDTYTEIRANGVKLLKSLEGIGHDIIMRNSPIRGELYEQVETRISQVSESKTDEPVGKRPRRVGESSGSG